MGSATLKLNLIGGLDLIKKSWLESRLDVILNFGMSDVGDKKECLFCAKVFSGGQYRRKHYGRMHCEEIKMMTQEVYFREYFLAFHKDELRPGFEKFKNAKK